MKLAILELPARSGDIAGGLADIRSLLSSGSCDLAIVPECALTGYVSPRGDFDLSRFAEPLEGPTLEATRGLAADLGCHLAVPFVERDGERNFNAFVVVAPAGRIVAHYRKRHPWFPETWAMPGELPYPLFEIAGVRMTLAVCFDVHFLAREAEETLQRSDLLLFPSAWVDDDDEDARGPILGDLAQTFEIAIANANWGLGSPRIRGQGGSRFVARDARVVQIEAPASVPRRLDVEL